MFLEEKSHSMLHPGLLMPDCKTSSRERRRRRGRRSSTFACQRTGSFDNEFPSPSGGLRRRLRRYYFPIFFRWPLCSFPENHHWNRNKRAVSFSERSICASEGVLEASHRFAPNQGQVSGAPRVMCHRQEHRFTGTRPPEQLSSCCRRPE